MNLYSSYGRFLRDKFGDRVYKVSVDGGMGCPNRDGTLSRLGCSYCNGRSFLPRTADRSRPVEEQVRDGVEFLRKRYDARKFIVYFQPFSNTYAPIEKLIPLYESSMDHPDVVGLSVGTRPDCIDEGKIAWFENLARTRFVTLEYGLQSICDRTLARINRGHDFACWIDAVDRTRNRGIYIGAHLILGFPWEGKEEILRSADVLSAMAIDFLKLHHLHIVKDTPLAGEYRAEPFPLLGLDEYVELVIDFLERLDASIRIERFMGTSPHDQLVGPMWNTGRSGIRHRIESRMRDRNTWQGRLCS